MKKTLILSILLCFAFSGFAQLSNLATSDFRVPVATPPSSKNPPCIIRSMPWMNISSPGQFCFTGKTIRVSDYFKVEQIGDYYDNVSNPGNCVVIKVKPEISFVPEIIENVIIGTKYSIKVMVGGILYRTCDIQPTNCTVNIPD